ncbi:MAG TPA: hypothetical protein VF132_07605, partial [Rudaea sp.]
MAQIELRSGDYPAVERRLTVLLDQLSAQKNPRLRARALLTLATSFMRRNQAERAAEIYDEVLALRQDPPDQEVIGIARLGRGLVLSQRSRLDEATAELGRARIALQTAGDPLAVATVDVNLGDFQSLRHRPADALPMLDRAARQYRQLGAREGFAHSAVARANLHVQLLDPAAALAALDEVWPAESHTSNVRMRWSIVQARADVLASLGRFDEAQSLIERVRTQSDPAQDGATRALGEAVAASIAWQRGDLAAAAGLLAPPMLDTLARDDPDAYVGAALLYARANRRTGRAAAADEVLRALREKMKSEGDDWHQAYAALADAELAWSENRRDAALQAFAAANRYAERVNVPDVVVTTAVPAIEAMIHSQHLDDAQALAGRIAPWADRDARVAWAQVRLFRALGQSDAERRARDTAARLSGGVEPPETVEKSG